MLGFVSPKCSWPSVSPNSAAFDGGAKPAQRRPQLVVGDVAERGFDPRHLGGIELRRVGFDLGARQRRLAERDSGGQGWHDCLLMELVSAGGPRRD